MLEPPSSSSVCSWKQVWQRGKPIHVQTILYILLISFLAWGGFQDLPLKRIYLWMDHRYCGDQNQTLALQNSSLKVNVSGCRMLQRCLSFLNYLLSTCIFMYSWKAACNERCHRHMWTSSALDFWRSSALNHGGCFVSALDSDRTFKLFKLGSGAGWVCLPKCEEMKLVQIPYQCLHYFWFSYFPPARRGSLAFMISCSSFSTVGGITRRS